MNVDDLLIDSQHDPVDLVVGPNFIYWLEWTSADTFYGDGTLWQLANKGGAAMLFVPGKDLKHTGHAFQGVALCWGR